MPVARPPRFAALACLLVAIAARPLYAQDDVYRLPDKALKLVRIDTDEKESFLAVRADPAGRLFVGGREGLFVYEPDGKGGFGPRQLLVRFPNHAWVYDIAFRGNDVYASTVSAIYLIPGAVTQRKDLQPKRIVWGIPLGHVHQCIHNMDWGPEGDLYFSCGDPNVGYGDFRNRPDHWLHWTWFVQPEGTKVEYTGVGGVFRVRPDGSNLKVVSHGFRNSIGLTFDAHWNLFTNDNDHESLPADYVPGRLVHVTPHTYFSWPRGWIPEKQAHRPDLLQTMNDHLGRYVPVGQTVYDDTYLPEKYRDSLIVDRWEEHKLAYYPIEPRGASFAAQEHDLLLCKGDARPVGVAVGNGGCVFVTVCYMPANDASPTYRSDVVMIQRADAPPSYKGFDITKAAAKALEAELSSADWSRRHAAHQEMIRRNIRPPASGPIAPPHTIWLSTSPAELTVRAADVGPIDARVQALRALAEQPGAAQARTAFVSAVAYNDPRVQLAGIQGLFAIPPGPVPQAVIDGPARSTDTYLRHTAAMLLAEKAPASQIKTLLESDDTATRLAGVLAAGFRLTIPPTTGPVPESLSLDTRAQAGSFTISNFYDSPKVDLRKLGRVGNFTMAQWWKDVKHTPEQEELFALLQKSLADADTQVRYEAAFFLNLLNDSRVGPRIAEVFTEFAPKSLGAKQPVTELWAAGPFADARRGFNVTHAPEEGPINLTAKYAQSPYELAWKRVAGQQNYFDFDTLLTRSRDSSVYAYFRLESAKAQPAVLWIGSQQQVRVYQNGRVVWENSAGRAYKPDEDRVLLNLQPGSNDFLIRVHTSARAVLGINVEAASPVRAVLPDALGTQQLAERLAQAKDSADATTVPPEFAKLDWEKEYKSGDVARGRQLFDSLGCSKCHAATSDAPGGGGGPSLADAGKRFTIPYVVESILLPNKVVSPLFRATVVRLNNGDLLAGLVVNETADTIELRLQDTTLKTINTSDINARRQEDRSPMPQGLVRTTAELKDLLAFVMRDAEPRD